MRGDDPLVSTFSSSYFPSRSLLGTTKQRHWAIAMLSSTWHPSHHVLASCDNRDVPLQTQGWGRVETRSTSLVTTKTLHSDLMRSNKPGKEHKFHGLFSNAMTYDLVQWSPSCYCWTYPGRRVPWRDLLLKNMSGCLWEKTTLVFTSEACTSFFGSVGMYQFPKRDISHISVKIGNAMILLREWKGKSQLWKSSLLNHISWAY